MRVTLKDLVEKTGISKSVVSMYLNKDPRVRLTDERKKRIDAAVRELGYRPSHAACALRKGRSRMLGIVLGGITDAFFSRMAEACLYYAEKRGYQLLMSLTSWNPEKERICLENLIERQVDGIIYSAYPFFDDAFRKKIEDSGVPLLHFGEKYPYFLSVRRELESAFDSTVEMLVRRGFRKVLFCAYSYADEVPVFRNAAAAAGMELELLDILPFEQKGGDWLDKNPLISVILQKRPEAIYCGCEIARQLISRIRSEKLEYCPEIVTNYHFPFDFVDDPLIVGVIAGQFYERARLTVNMLIDRIESPDGNTPSVSFVKYAFYERDEFSRIKDQLIDTLEKAERNQI